MAEDETEMIAAVVPPRRIALLPPDVVAQIAAGEVIERPASAVKELIENALDAGATTIEVDIEGGGRSSIRVADDGHGMSSEEVATALERHATSKLRQAEELTFVRTLGFRGEGLSSVAAVSRVRLVSRRRADARGVELIAEGGRVALQRPAGCRAGTTIQVSDLFFNTPARAKFLKTPATESGHVADLVARTALGFEGVHFRLRQGARLSLDLPAHLGGRAQRVRDVLGAAGGSLVETDALASSALRVHAFLAPPDCTASTTRSLFFLVNRRSVRDRVLLQAVVAACEGRIASGRYPIGVVYLDLDAEQVDVNVHPQKLEVRFADTRGVHRAVTEAVSRALAGRSALQAPARVYRLGDRASRGAAESFADEASREQEAAWRFWGPVRASERLDEHDDFGLAAALERVSAKGEGREGVRPRLVGQALGRVVVCEWGERLLLVEELAGWAAVVRQRLRASLSDGGLHATTLRTPLVLELASDESAHLGARSAQLAHLGFSFELFGGTSWVVRAVPGALRWVDPADSTVERAAREERLRALIRALLAELAANAPDDAREGAARVPEVLVWEAARAARARGSVAELVDELGQLGEPACLGFPELELPGSARAWAGEAAGGVLMRWPDAASRAPDR